VLKVIVAGSRSFETEHNRKQAEEALKFLWDIPGTIRIVSGGARGADSIAEDIAAMWTLFDPSKKSKFSLKVFEADWETNGRAAGILRNKDMAIYADCLVAFWDGKSPGTRNMIEEMMKRDKPYMVFGFNGKRLK